MDTWLGDVNMRVWKGLWLGPQGRLGQPRLFEQFMANVAGSGFREIILPVGTSASVGLRYYQRLLPSIPRPYIIYVDAAHQFGETLDEIRESWKLVAPGGLVMGDDYHHLWPGVQAAVTTLRTPLQHDTLSIPLHMRALGP
jgi:hypothetical protein